MDKILVQLERLDRKMQEDAKIMLQQMELINQNLKTLADQKQKRKVRFWLFNK